MTGNHHPGTAYRADIDGLRALAIVPVVLFHANLGLPGGYVGVDVFFVISGFLITRIIFSDMVGGKFSYADFYERRLRRLLPAAFAVFAAVTVWAWWKLAWFDLASYGKSLAAAVAYVSNFNFYWETGYFNEDAMTKLLLHTWSLAVEEQFYIVVPLLLAPLVRCVPRRFVLRFLAAATVASFGLSVVLTEYRAVAAFYLLPARAWELGIGGVLALGSREWARGRYVGEAVSVAGFAAITFAVMTFSEATPFPGWHAAIPVLGCAALLAAGDAPGTISGTILRSRPLVWIGSISYSLYLWHWPVMVAMSYGTDKLSGTRSVIAIAISVALAFASLHLVEQPVRRRRALASRRQLFAFAGLGTMAFLLVGLAMYHADGFPQPSPDQKSMAQWVAPAKQDDVLKCYEPGIQRILRSDICVHGRKGVAPSFVLVGDSHAEASSHAIFQAADTLGVSGYSIMASGYMLLPGRNKISPGYQPEDLTPAVLTWLDQRKDIRTIVLTGYWLYEATSVTYRHKGTQFTDDKYDGSGLAYNPVALRNALDRLAERYPDRRIVLIDDVPSGNAIFVKHFIRGIIARGEAKSALPRAVADEQQKSYMPVLEAVAADHANVRVHRLLTDAVCDDRWCTLFDGDRNMKFVDGDHVSADYLKRYSPVIARALAADLKP